jgi:two-component system cell cycle sensor histidine kinase/response regulator CckA
MGMKILIVDDNKENLYFLETMLKGNGYQVISATNGAEALEKLSTDGFDMIISDILMPVMDGFQLCRECKRDDKLKDILFIFYTATYVDEKDEELALMLGADKFIRKPMEPDEFMSIIRGIIGDLEAGKLVRQKPAAKDEKEVFKLYSERLVNKLEKKMLDLETEIARRKQTGEKLRQSENKYRTLFEASADGILIADMETRQFQYANPAMCRMLGYTEEELRTMDVAAIHPKEDLQRVVAEFEAQARGDKTLAPDIPCLRKDGTIVYADINTVNITVDGRKCNAGFFRDVTQRKQAEQQALVNAKLASVGELVAGVAHEINNPLTGIIGYAQLLADRQDVPQNIKDDLQKIYEESRRTVRIVQNLLRFARQYKPEKSLVDINELLERTLELEAYKRRTSNIELSTKLAADIPLMLADYNQLQQVILNIMTNAQQAITDTKRKGKITVTTETVEDYVRVSITDNGPGISPENMTKIFDPFFTTKPEGSGSGLGLSVCHGIIVEHGGNIYAESTPTKGTTFTIELPIATGEQAVIRDEKPAKKSSRRPRRKMTCNILIVEDEPGIRAVLTRNLSAEGYQAQTVPDGKAALDKLAKNDYDLIFTDLKMPGMTGRELYEAIKKKHPNSAEKVVFITGDVMTAATHDFLVSTGRQYLIKPFDSKDITGVIEKVLGENNR